MHSLPHKKMTRQALSEVLFVQRFAVGFIRVFTGKKKIKIKIKSGGGVGEGGEGGLIAYQFIAKFTSIVR